MADQYSLNIRKMFTFHMQLGLPRQGDSNRYQQNMFSQRITWDCQRKNKDPLNFVQAKVTL